MRHFAPMHRLSTYAFAALAGVLFHPGLASAVALGNIALQSSLGQPLRVVIPVALNSGEVLNTSCLKLVRDAEPGTPQLLTGRVSLERNAASTRLIVTTPKPMDEPALRISVQAGCGNTVRRDYVLLLDPQGTASDAMLASVDVDQFRNYASSAPPPAARHAQPAAVAADPVAAPVRVAKFDPAPAPTTFKPIAAPVQVAAAAPRAQNVVPPAVVPTAVVPPAVVPSAPVVVAMVPVSAPREPVALTTVQPPAGFIREAGAASLSRVSMESAQASSASPQAALLGTQVPTPEETLWTQTWPYAAILLSLVAIALTAFAKRRGAVVPAWGAPTVLDNSKSPMGRTENANTFAHFSVMTEPAPALKRKAATAHPTVSDDSTYDASLDTLLEPTQEDGGINLNLGDGDEINEHTVRKAWATLANESAVDIGTDSILKAIAEAERDLRIGAPEPKQAAMDKALDDDLLRAAKARS